MCWVAVAASSVLYAQVEIRERQDLVQHLVPCPPWPSPSSPTSRSLVAVKALAWNVPTTVVRDLAPACSVASTDPPAPVRWRSSSARRPGPSRTPVGGIEREGLYRWMPYASPNPARFPGICRSCDWSTSLFGLNGCSRQFPVPQRRFGGRRLSREARSELVAYGRVEIEFCASAERERA